MGIFKRRINPKLTNRANALIEEAQKLAEIINKTYDEREFKNCYIRLEQILKELCRYERTVKFIGSPKEDLADLKQKEQLAYQELLNRREIHTKLSSSKPIINGVDEYFYDAGIAIIQHDKASIGMIQRILKIGFNRAVCIMNQLCDYGVVGEEDGTKPRKVLMDIPLFEMLVYELISNKFTTTYQREPATSDSIDIDNMEGHDFEYFCADILRKNGFINVEVTQGSGDHGIDVLAEKDDITYAIQCKCYSSNIGNAAVQQAHTGKTLYHRDVAVVMTNQYFTQQAKEEAQTLRVKLWDRDKLNDFIEKSEI